MPRRFHMITKKSIRVGEIALNILMRGCWEGLALLTRFRADMDIPDFHAAIKARDLRTVSVLSMSLTKAGYNPRHIYRIAASGVKGLSMKQWHDMLLEAHISFPETTR